MKKQWGLNYSSVPLWNNSFLEKQIHFSWAQALNVLPASKTTPLILSICNTLLSPIFKVPFFVARNQPHHTVYHELHGFFLTLAAYIYAFTVSICTTSKISAWRQGNTVTNCNDLEPSGFMILDVTFCFCFLIHASRGNQLGCCTWISKTGCCDLLFGVCRETTLFMLYGVNLFFKRHGAILKIAALRLYYTRIIDLLPLDFKRSFCWASVLIPKNLK